MIYKLYSTCIGYGSSAFKCWSSSQSHGAQVLKIRKSCSSFLFFCSQGRFVMLVSLTTWPSLLILKWSPSRYELEICSKTIITQPPHVSTKSSYSPLGQDHRNPIPDLYRRIPESPHTHPRQTRRMMKPTKNRTANNEISRCCQKQHHKNNLSIILKPFL